MYLAINIVGVLVFLAIGWLLSKDRKQINWRAIAVMVLFNLFLAWFLTSFSIGRAIVDGAAAGFNELMKVAYVGIEFAVPSMVKVKQMDWFVSVLLPILMIVPLFDILTYIGILPWVIKWIGRGLSWLTGQPKFESFFAIEMMFLGNTEALAISSLQLKQMKAERERRESILIAEGEKKSTILVAEGKKESVILDAQAEKQAAILRAEAEKEKMIREAEGEAEAILKVQQANADGIRMLKEAGADESVLTLKSLEALGQLANGTATKIVVPSDLQGIASLATSLTEIVKTKDAAAGK